MTRTTQVITTDDLDGSPDAIKIEFSYKGTAYAIDLGASNEAAFDRALDPFIAVATKVGRSAGSARSIGSSRDLGLVRTWAKENGFSVSDRGRISARILDAYDATH